jgi:hypothetical protein
MVSLVEPESLRDGVRCGEASFRADAGCSLETRTMSMRPDQRMDFTMIADTAA